MEPAQRRAGAGAGAGGVPAPPSAGPAPLRPQPARAAGGGRGELQLTETGLQRSCRVIDKGPGLGAASSSCGGSEQGGGGTVGGGGARAVDTGGVRLQAFQQDAADQVDVRLGPVQAGRRRTAAGGQAIVRWTETETETETER